MTDTQPDTAASKPESEMSDIERIKAAHAARLARRSRPPRPPTSSIIPPPSSADESNGAADDASSGAGAGAGVGAGSKPGAKDASTAAGEKEAEAKDEEKAKLRDEIKSLKLELSSLRRNHLQNIKAISEQRDMFAEQLAREQQQQNPTDAGERLKRRESRNEKDKKLADLEAQLRAARIRNSDLESENTLLRDEVKQLTFRVQASKTLDAASNGYQQVVDDLVHVKLQCAQLSEEKEDLLRINKELTTTSNVLRESNGELEKSRSHWVLQCAEVEKKRTELEKLLKQRQSSTSSSSYKGNRDDVSSDLQELKL